MVTYGDWFSGGGGMTIGAAAAGACIVFGAEYDEQVADVYRANVGEHVIVGDVLDIPMDMFPYVDIFHASPPCPNFSTAKLGAKETEADIALGNRVAEYIRERRPRIFTLENVYKYRNSESFSRIISALHDHGYTTGMWHVNMADYGVSQTRMRLIVVALRDGLLPSLPPPTHSETVSSLGGLELWGVAPKKKWVSWYESIEDLIPFLPDSQFAPWQLNRLPDEFRTLLLSGMDMRSTGRGMRGRDSSEPATTVTASDFRRPSTIPSAFICNDADSRNPFRGSDEPASTVVTHDTGGTMSRAFITDRLNGGNKTPNRFDDEPAATVVCHSPRHQPPNGFVGGRVVQMTTRCLARFQSFPDWYKLPDNNKAGSRVVGNAVPPLFAQKFYRHLIDTYIGGVK